MSPASSAARAKVIPVKQNRSTVPLPTANPFAEHAGLAMYAVGIILLLGSVIDLAVLWGLQRQDVPQWEFVALASTLEAFPRFALALAFLYGGQVFRQVRSMARYRTLAVVLLLLGLGAGAMGALVAMDYFAITKFMTGQPQAQELLRTTAIKALALSALFFSVLVPVGLLGLRGPKIRR